MQAPPIRAFHSREALIEAINVFALNQGYIMVIERSVKDEKVVLKCDRESLTG